jgi:hypothetical protein
MAVLLSFNAGSQNENKKQTPSVPCVRVFVSPRFTTVTLTGVKSVQVRGFVKCFVT